MSVIKIIGKLAKGRGAAFVETPEYKAPQTGDITFADSDFNFSEPSATNANYVSRSPAAYVEFKTEETSLIVKIGGNWVKNNHQSDCYVLVNGSLNQTVRLTVNDTIQEKPITLPSGLKDVKLINGYRANNPTTGVFIQGVITSGPIEVKTPVTPYEKWLFLGDSITTGASGTHPTLTGYAPLFRNDGKNVQLDSWGARVLGTNNSTTANALAAHLSLQMDGANTNKLFIALGTNNFGLQNQSKATYKTYYDNLLTAIRAIRTDIEVWCISPLIRTTYDTANSSGATLADYDDAIKELITVKGWPKYVYGKTLASLSNMGDGLHPNQTGMQQIHDNLSLRILAGGDPIV